MAVTVGNERNHRERIHHLVQRPLIVMKQKRIVEIESTTREWKSLVLPLNYIRKFCSGIILPLLRLVERRAITTMTHYYEQQFITLNVCQTECPR